MIMFRVNNNIKFPKEFITKDELMEVAQKIFVPSLAEGIDRQIGIDGLPLPRPENINAVNKKISKSIFTKKGDIRSSSIRKISESGLLSFAKRVLIDTGKLRRSFMAKSAGKTSVKINLTSDRAEIGKHLQIDGIKTRKGLKKYNFFGVSEGMEKNATDYAKEKIAIRCKDFNGKR